MIEIGEEISVYERGGPDMSGDIPESGLPMHRRRFLRGAAVVAGAALVPTLGSSLAGRAGAAAATRPSVASGVDPVQRFVQLVPGGNGILYAVQSDGALYWYRHAGWADGSPTWANGAGTQIG